MRAFCPGTLPDLEAVKRISPSRAYPMNSHQLVCYCFEYTAEDIRRDFEAHGHSTILDRIKAEKKLGNCQCGVKNPKGR